MDMNSQDRNFMNFDKPPFIPLFRSAEDRRLNVVATATLINIDSQPYFLTAGHAADDLKGQEVSTLIGNSVFQLNKLCWNRFPANLESEYMDLDFALMRVPECLLDELNKHNSFFKEDAFASESPATNEIIHVYGYPASKSNKKITMKHAKVYCYKLITTDQTFKLVGSTRFHPDGYLAVEFDKKSVKDEMNREILPPDFHGVSGGPGVLSEDKKLLGIVIEKDDLKNIMILTRIHIITQWVKVKSQKFQ